MNPAPAADADEGLVPVPLRVRAVENEIAEVVTLRLEGAPPRGAVAPGQFNMLYAFGVGEVAISASGDPAAPDTVHTVRALGAVTRALCALAPGQVVGVRGPFGQPWPVEVAAGGDLLLVAGGLGLAPLRPVVYHALRHRDRYRRVVVLVGARSPADLLFGDELSSWKADPASGLEVHVIVDRAGADWKGRVGVVTELIAEAVRDPGSTFAFICGPEAMMRFSVRPLERAGIPDGRIFVSMERNMKCAAGFCGHCQLGPLFMCKDGPVFPFERVRPWFYTREL
jgi:NAD(P)H-flavin reductase